MTTPAPERTTRRRRPAGERPHSARPQLKLGLTGWTVSWLVPTALMGAVLLALSFFPGLDGEGYLTPLIPLLGAAAVVVGIPGTLLVSWLLRHHLNPVVHMLGYVLVGLLYGPVVLFAGASGLMPMLIPIIGFPAGILLGIGRWIAQPLATVTHPEQQVEQNS
ncbi:hypothetical protein [Nesterenkonia alkaliphila]|uniref:Uncharacterized protein n=1 Tax=Nesterenkonia alkaliphila TaxID=1463631 RepID=A0A7K1UJF7_9MICC|nr:hypothetical protein [Nesterenkonia alkaliphila]MVT26472.1 hypothetical protein [Nesterenkonia alkaliphila]GFZ81321.1 hypothetical protein GCM10011359_07270 [Nesterenkonia alkaliphila]